jgi:hypothetical protein
VKEESTKNGEWAETAPFIMRYTRSAAYWSPVHWCPVTATAEYVVNIVTHCCLSRLEHLGLPAVLESLPITNCSTITLIYHLGLVQ